MSNDRPYRSSLREEQARETRLRIREAARRLFTANGFSDTTVSRIAREAGVAPQTVYAVFGSKGAIIAGILESLEDGADERGRIAEMIAVDDPHRQLRLFVAWIRALFEQGAPVLRAALTALSDPDVAAFTDRGDEARLRGCRQITGIWAENGALRDDIEHEQAAQRLWLLTNAEQYLAATGELGWNSDQYEQWLGDLLASELLKPV